MPNLDEEADNIIGQEKESKDEVSEGPVLNGCHAVASRPRRHDLSRKAELSAYMAIAASAFGLISDGCELQP